MGIIGLAGVAMVPLSGWPLSTWWLWAGVVAVVASSVALARGVKPAQVALRDGDDSARTRWFVFALGHWALIIGIFGVMQAFS